MLDDKFRVIFPNDRRYNSALWNEVAGAWNRRHKSPAVSPAVPDPAGGINGKNER